jgi:hypothetical protein
MRCRRGYGLLTQVGPFGFSVTRRHQHRLPDAGCAGSRLAAFRSAGLPSFLPIPLGEPNTPDDAAARTVRRGRNSDGLCVIAVQGEVRVRITGDPLCEKLL